MARIVWPVISIIALFVCWYWCLVSTTEPFCHINKEYVGSINSTEAGLCSVMQPAVMVCIGRMRRNRINGFVVGDFSGPGMFLKLGHWQMQYIDWLQARVGFPPCSTSPNGRYLLEVGQETKDHSHCGVSVRLTPWCCHALAPDNRHTGICFRGVLCWSG